MTGSKGRRVVKAENWRSVSNNISRDKQAPLKTEAIVLVLEQQCRGACLLAERLAVVAEN